jgi:hypothetical protein
MVLSALSLMFFAATAVAHATLFGYANGYTATSQATQVTGNTAKTWPCEIEFTGTQTDNNVLWLIMQFTNWQGDNSNPQ